MKRCLLIFTLFLDVNSYAQNIDSLKNSLLEDLKSKQTELIIVHRFLMLNGRFYIPYDNKDLNCDGIPAVYNVFWLDSDILKCQRIDPCGYFEPIQIDNFIDIKEIGKVKNNNVDFFKNSPHYTLHTLNIYQNNSVIRRKLSGKQIKKGSGSTIKFMKKLEKKIRELEEGPNFKRAEQKSSAK